MHDSFKITLVGFHQKLDKGHELEYDWNVSLCFAILRYNLAIIKELAFYVRKGKVVFILF